MSDGYIAPAPESLFAIDDAALRGVRLRQRQASYRHRAD